MADFQVRDAFETLDNRGVENTPETRRNIRLDVQREVIECNAEVINDFGAVALQLKKTGDALSSLQKTCAILRKNMNAARVETMPMLDEASHLTKLTDQVHAKQRMLSDFKGHFLISDDDLVFLTSSTDPVDDNFFHALVEAKQIHQDSEILLGSDSQRLGLEVLEHCNANIRAGFQKLFHWTQRELQTLNLEDSHLSPIIRRALRVLAERPTLFQQCLSTFTQVRERALADAFYIALNGTAAEHEPQKPIEFSAHEPLRYVGDMLAWVHSTAVSEHESLEGLFIADGDEIARSIEAGLESEPWSNPGDGAVFDGRRALSQLVNENLLGVAQLLRQRIDTVIHTHNEPLLEYKIANLVVFYRNIFTKLLQGEEFMKILDTVEDAALVQFRHAMELQLNTIDQGTDAIPEELGVPEFLGDAIENLQQLLRSYDTSAAPYDVDGRKLSFLLEEALNPWLAACDRLALSLESPRSECFVINCLTAAYGALQQYPFTKGRERGIKKAIETQTSSLVEYQHQLFLVRSGVQPLVEALKSLPPPDEQPEAVLEHELFTEQTLYDVREQLDNFLPSALMDARSDLKGLQGSSLSHEVSNAAAEAFCGDFEKVEEALVAADRLQRERYMLDNEARTLREVFPRTTDEARVLLS
ncbi:MAG: hypothetical protein Q9159_004740 [Coniocarpon cinnabarinum]